MNCRATFISSKTRTPTRTPGTVPTPPVVETPPPFDALYPHLLCAQMDAALGETDRYAGEQAQYNALYAELAVWLRQNYPPRSRAQWRW